MTRKASLDRSGKSLFNEDPAQATDWELSSALVRRRRENDEGVAIEKGVHNACNGCPNDRIRRRQLKMKTIAAVLRSAAANPARERWKRFMNKLSLRIDPRGERGHVEKTTRSNIHTVAPNYNSQRVQLDRRL